MTETFQQWVSQVNGQAVDVESGYGAQCYGLMKSYMNNVVGAPGEISTQFGPYPGFAINTYTGYQQAGLAPYFEQLPPSAGIQQGDVVFWPWGSSIAPESHVAVANDATHFWSQNSPQKYTTLQELPTNDIAGILRPVNAAGLGLANPDSSPPNNTTATQPVANTNAAPASWISDFMGLSFIENLILRLFMPSTWIRILSGWLAFLLFIVGIIFIVMDYRKNSNAES